MPIATLPRLLLSLVSLLLLGAAVYLIWMWFQGYDVRYADGTVRHFHGRPWRLYVAAGLFAWSFLGRFVVLMVMPPGADEPREERGEAATVVAPDGSVLNVETFGAKTGPTVILTHGWGLNSTAWWYTKHALASRYRVVTWDLPGLGRSKPPKDGRYSIDRFAEALGAVVGSVGDGPLVLVGHSIGGMTTQTFWRACPEHLKQRVVAAILVDTTHENPLRTMWLAPLWQALRWPLIEPMMWLTIPLSPLVWLSSWQSYLSGASQLAMRLTGFGSYATRGQVDFSARLACKGSPAVQAKGNLAMFRWKITDTLPTIPAPILVLAGTKDIVTLPSASAFIAGALPHGQLRRIGGGGHMGFMERSHEYNDAIVEFVGEAFAASAPAKV